MKLTLAFTLLLIQQIFAASDEQWAAHKKEHNVTTNDQAEENVVRGHYERTDDFINKHNAEAANGKHKFTVGHNSGSHMSPEEKAARNGYKAGPAISPRASRYMEPKAKPIDRASLPKSVDLRGPCMSPIQNQGYCGSCWTFSATASLEYAYCKVTKPKTLIKLSEQNIVDCAHQGGSPLNGCDGGNYLAAWDYAAAKQGDSTFGYFNAQNSLNFPKPTIGQDTLASYPYTSGAQSSRRGGSCKFTSSNAPVAAVPTYRAQYGQNLAWYKVTPNNNAALMKAVAEEGVISVSVWANDDMMYHYKTGVFTADRCVSPVTGKTNHAINVIGYGQDGGDAYWIVRNSWGKTWGQEGYGKFERSLGSANGMGTCNILKDPAYPKAKATSNGGGGGGDNGGDSGDYSY